MPRRTAAEAAATRDALVAAAREAFCTAGYAATSLEAIARAAGVTRGAVHHHFKDKRALFVEVFTALEHELNEAVVSAALAAPPGKEVRAGCEALFDVFAGAHHRQVAVTDAPAVLGLADWYAIDRGIGMPTMRAGLQGLADAGLLEPALVEPLAVLLFGALTEAALVLGAGIAEIDREQVLDAFDRLLAGVVTPPG